MAVDIPQTAPPVAALAVSAPECRYLTKAEANLAVSRLQQRLKSTKFNEPQPSEICGLAMAKLNSGTVIYTDATGRYLMLTFALDTHKGSPADTETLLEEAIELRQTQPGRPVLEN